MPIESKTTLFFCSEILISKARLRIGVNKDHVNELAQSIRTHGLLHNIVVDRDTGEIIAGEHRLRAFQLNAYLERPCPLPEYEDWLCIPARLAYDVTAQELLALELSENIKAKKMDWKEIALGVERIHDFSQDSDQTRAVTASLLGMTPQAVGNNLKAAFHLGQEEELVLAATSLTGAMNVIARIEERRFDSLKEDLRSGMSIEEVLGDSVPEDNMEDFAESPSGDLSIRQPSEKCTTEIFSQPESTWQVIPGDFIEWAAQYKGKRFNLIHCDFPYGINYDKSGFDYAKHHSIYGDSKDLYFALLSALCENTGKLCTDSAHLIFWFNSRYQAETVSMLSEAGWTVWPHHLIWHKSDNAGVLADPRRGPRHTYETALFATRGDRKLVKPVADSYSGPTTRDSGHVSEKPISMVRHFFSLVVDSSTRILDPTAGSFNSLVAAKQAGAQAGVGVELDSEYAARGERILKTLDEEG